MCTSSKAQAAWTTYSISLLCAINLINYAVRYVPAALKTFLQNEFTISDANTGLVMFVFMSSYLISAPLMGSLSDAGMHRPLIIFLGLAFWTTGAVCTLLANDYASFLLTRVAVGIGQAAFVSLAPCLISDILDISTAEKPPASDPDALLTVTHKAFVQRNAFDGIASEEAIRSNKSYSRADCIREVSHGDGASSLTINGSGAAESPHLTVSLSPSLLSSPRNAASVTGVTSALGIFQACLPLGAALGYVASTLLAQRYGWRAAFAITAAPGYLLCFIVLLIRDTRKRALVVRLPSWSKVIRALAQNPTYRMLLLASVFMTWGAGALVDWLPTFLTRRSEVDPRFAAFIVAALMVMGGILGSIAGACITSVLTGLTRNPLFATCAFGVFGAAIAFLGAIVFAGNLEVAGVLALLGQICFCLQAAPVSVLLVRSVPPEMQSRACAFYITCIHLFGDASSPAIIGKISDVEGIDTGMRVIVAALLLSATTFAFQWRCGVLENSSPIEWVGAPEENVAALDAILRSFAANSDPNPPSPVPSSFLSSKVASWQEFEMNEEQEERRRERRKGSEDEDENILLPEYDYEEEEEEEARYTFSLPLRDSENERIREAIQDSELIEEDDEDNDDDEDEEDEDGSERNMAQLDSDLTKQLVPNGKIKTNSKVCIKKEVKVGTASDKRKIEEDAVSSIFTISLDQSFMK